jgi:hypothetical protein
MIDRIINALIIVAIALVLLTVATLAYARELYPGQYAQVDPAISEWFKAQRSPGGVPCCDDADGTQADEQRDPETGHLQTRFTYFYYDYAHQVGETANRIQARTEWMDVPEDVIIRGGQNPTGNPVVWYYVERGGVPKIRCYKRTADG